MVQRHSSAAILAGKHHPIVDWLEPRAQVLGAAALVVVTCLAYFPVVWGGFILDDDLLVVQNQVVKDPGGLYRIWFTTDAVDYWPVTNTLFWIQWQLWGANPLGYHLVNLALHIVAALGVWVVLRELSIPGALLAAMLFAVHPVNVETVAWISQLKTILAVVFCLLSIYYYVRANSPLADRAGLAAERFLPPGAAAWYWRSLAAFVLGMLSKASIVGLPLVLLLIVWWRRGRLAKWDLIRIAPFVLVTIPLVLVNLWFRHHGMDEDFRPAGFVERLVGAGVVPWFYLSKAIFPVNLGFIYPQWEIDAGNPLWWLPLAAAVAVTVALWSWRNTAWGRALFVAWTWYWLALAPVLGFVDATYMKWSLVADHYQYLAIINVLAVVAAALTLAFASLPQGAWANASVSAVLVGILALLTFRHCEIYRDPITLYTNAIQRNPECWVAYNNLALALQADQRPLEAIKRYEEAIQVRPDFPEAHNNLGATLYVTGHPQAAVEHFKEAVRLKPEYPNPHYNLGKDLLYQGYAQESLPYFKEALRLRPDYGDAHNDLGLALLQLGRVQEARDHLQHALRLSPTSAEAQHNLGVALLNAGRPQEAIEHFTSALRLQANYARAELNLGNALLRVGQTARAIEHLERAVALEPDLAEAHNLLGTALVGSGNSRAAIEHFRQVARIEPDQPGSHNNLGAALLKAGQANEAVESLERAVRLSPQYVEAWTSLAAAQAQAQRRAEATAAAKTALELARAQGKTGLATQLEAFLTSLDSQSNPSGESPSPTLPPAAP